MANLRGALLKGDVSSILSNEKRYISQDISSLGIVVPFRVAMRVRGHFDHGNSSDEWRVGIGVKFGTGDNLYQEMALSSKGAADQSFLESDINTANQLTSGLTSYRDISTAAGWGDGTMGKVWGWIQLEIDDNFDLYSAFSNDTGTTNPDPTWLDRVQDTSEKVSASNEDTIQEVYCYLRFNTDSSSRTIVLVEIDQVEVIQD